jgi:hypothetical protein
MCNLRFRSGGATGALMSFLDMHLTADPDDIYQDGDPDLNYHDAAKAWQPADGVAIPQSAVDNLPYRENVMWWFSMGAAWRDSWEAAQWLDNPIPWEGYATTDDPADTEFDAFALQAEARLYPGSLAEIVITGSASAWTPTYTATAKDSGGSTTATGTWTGATSDPFDITGAATITVQAANSRGGKSDTVTITL